MSNQTNKRFYERLNVENVKGIVYFGGGLSNDADIQILNISEDGIGFKTREVTKIKEGDTCKVLIIDANPSFSSNDECFINVISVRIIHKTGKNIGAKIISGQNSYESYVLNKKAQSFIQNLKNYEIEE